MLFLAACAVGREHRSPEGDGVALLNLDPAVEFVGQEACRECHPEIHDDYQKNGMGLAFHAMSPDVVVEDFIDNNTFVDERTGLHYLMEERHGKFFQRQFLVDSKGRERFAEEHEIQFVMGSNYHTRSYVYEMKEGLFQLPICWYPRDSVWDLCPGFDSWNEHFSRETARRCVFCHAGPMDAHEGERNRYLKPYPYGIGCERCHGPGQLHVDRWSGDESPTGDADPTIAHPGRLPRAERMAVCSQCHLGARRVERLGTVREAYRPGQKLDDVAVSFQYVEPTQWGFGLGAQALRMMRSRCYVESGAMECMTCHDSHRTIYREDRAPDSFRQACLGCHAVDSCAGPDERRRATTPFADNCVACHMRKAGPKDHPRIDFTDHWIRRDVDLQGPDPRKQFRLEAVFPDEFAALSAAEKAYYTGRARMMQEGLPRHIQDDFLVSAANEFQEAIDGGLDRVEVWFELGQAKAKQGKYEEAIEALEAGYRVDPLHHDNAFALGQAMLAKGDLNRAAEIFEAMLRQKREAMVLAELGRVATEQRNVNKAIDLYRLAILEEPWHADLHHNLGMLLAAKGDFESASREGTKGLQLDPDNPEIINFYMQVQKAAGNHEESAEAWRFLKKLSGAPVPGEQGSTMGD